MRTEIELLLLTSYSYELDSAQAEAVPKGANVWQEFGSATKYDKNKIADYQSRSNTRLKCTTCSSDALSTRIDMPNALWYVKC